MFDIGLSPYGDLIFSAARDLQGKSGTSLYDQIITTRLRIRRGSWLYDRDGTLGSRIPETFNRPREDAVTLITAMIQEALREVENISILNIEIWSEDNSVTAEIYYQITTPGLPVNPDFQAQSTVIVPFIVGGE